MAVERWSAATRMLNIGVAAAYGLALAFAIASPVGVSPGSPRLDAAKAGVQAFARSGPAVPTHFVVAIR